MKTSRRTFLTASACLAATRASFARGLDEAVRRPARAYDLAPGLSYLNHASIGTVPRAVREAHAGYLQVCEANPWLHVWGGAWDATLHQTHAQAAAFLGCEPADAALLRNTTAAFGLAANGLQLVQGARDEVLFSSLNHVGASASWEAAAEARGYAVRRFAFPEDDVPGLSEDDLVALYDAALSERTAVLVLPHVDNVLGIRHPVRAIARRARERGVRFVCVDGAQSIGMHPVSVSELGVDLYATSAHKWLQAPKGSGLMFVSPRMREHLRPLVATWGQGRWQGTAQAYSDFGTRDLARLLALGNAVRFHESFPGDRQEHHRRLFEHARARTEAHAKLDWRSPREYAGGAALYAIGLAEAGAGAVAGRLFEEHGIVVRPFEGGGRNHLRVSPNTMNSTAELERFFEALDAARG